VFTVSDDDVVVALGLGVVITEVVAFVVEVEVEESIVAGVVTLEKASLGIKVVEVEEVVVVEVVVEVVVVIVEAVDATFMIDDLSVVILFNLSDSSFISS